MDGIINFIESEGMQRVMMMYGVLIVFFGVIDFIEFKIKRKKFIFLDIFSRLDFLILC